VPTLLSRLTLILLVATAFGSGTAETRGSRPGPTAPLAGPLLRQSFAAMNRGLHTVHLFSSDGTSGDCVTRGSELAAHFWLHSSSGDQQFIAIQSKSVDSWERSAVTGSAWKHVMNDQATTLLAMCPTSPDFPALTMRTLSEPCGSGRCVYTPPRTVGVGRIGRFRVWHLRETRTEQNGATFAWLRESQDLYIDAHNQFLVRIAYHRNDQSAGAMPESTSSSIAYSRFNAPVVVNAPTPAS